MPQVQQPEQRINDQLDPRFPHVDGPVRRFPTPPMVNLPGHPQPSPQDTAGIAQPPEVMKAV
jgi:hypothetical protein